MQNNMNAIGYILILSCMFLHYTEGTNKTYGGITTHPTTTDDILGKPPEDIDFTPRPGVSYKPKIPNFELEKQLRAEYRMKISKYEVKVIMRKYLFCDGNNPLGVHGLLDIDDEYSQPYLRGESAWTASCHIEEEPNPEYRFCDPDKTEIEICTHGELNFAMLERYGDPEQDCGSWQIVYDYISEDSTINELANRCKRRLNTVGCQRDSARAYDKNQFTVGGSNYFSFKFGLTGTNNHVHIHFWNTDAVFNADATNLQNFISYITCWDDYNFGSTWNRPQFCNVDDDNGRYTGIRASWMTNNGNTYWGDFAYPVANVVLKSPGTIDANYASLNAAIGTNPCTIAAITATSGYRITGVGGGSQCSRRITSDGLVPMARLEAGGETCVLAL